MPLTVVAFGGLSYSDTSMIQGRATRFLVVVLDIATIGEQHWAILQELVIYHLEYFL
jgi:hypothetical protein